MPLFLANPAGLWALLGVPVILLIHFLQRESRRYPVSTLFLLDALEKESVKGRRFDRLRQSIPMWLQLLATLLVTWLLVEPRWTSPQGVQRVVIVLDDSASMSAFRDELNAAFSRDLPSLSRFTGSTEFTLLESSSTGRTLSRVTSPGQLSAALENWNPSAGTHDPEPALRAGRGLAGTGGLLLFATDHPGPPLPFGAVRLAVGETIENVGFTGAVVEVSEDPPVWRASLKNHSGKSLARSWFLATGNSRTESRQIELEAGASRTLEGRFPGNEKRITLVLEPDRFTADDRLDLLVPSPKELRVARTGASSLEPLVNELIGSLDSVSPASPDNEPDLWFSSYNPLSPSESPPVSVVFSHQEQVPRFHLSGAISVALHTLVSDLDWQGLISRSTPSIPLAEGDRPLLWQGDRPLIFLRETRGRRQLVFNFDVATSNAPRLPAFVILVHRFANLIRSDKVAVEQVNAEWHQLLSLAHRSEPGAPPLEMRIPGQERTIPLNRARFLRAPASPGFFEVAQGETTLLRGASNFADVREADFTHAGSASEIAALPERLKERQTHEDPLRPLWIFLLGAVTLFAWWFPERSGSGDIGAAGQQEVGIP